MSKTPRTDKIKMTALTERNYDKIECVPVELSYQLETELADKDKQLAEARAEIERLKAPASPENLDERMKAAGMFTLAEMLAGTPLDKFCAHVGVIDMRRFEEWLLMRRKEFLTMQATMELNKDKHNDLYEWVIAHSAVFAEVLANFRQAKPDIERKDKLIEQMREALKACAEFIHYYDQEHNIGDGKVLEQATAALSAGERGE